MRKITQQKKLREWVKEEKEAEKKVKKEEEE